MDNDLQRLIGLRHAEAKKASRLQSRILQVQIALAALASATVYITNDVAAYVAAVATVSLAGLWAFFSWRYHDCRGQAERARRATVLMTGLGATLPKSDRMDLEAAFSVTADQGRECENPTYYAATAAVGPERLTEALEESVFWSARLMRYSARRTWWLFGGSFALSLLLLVSSLPVFGTQEVLGGVRVGCAMLVLLVSTDVIGAAFAYMTAATVLDHMGPRLDRIRAAGFPLNDLLFVLCDYNSAVEGAPMFVPGAYERNKDELNGLWARTHAPPNGP